MLATLAVGCHCWSHQQVSPRTGQQLARLHPPATTHNPAAAVALVVPDPEEHEGGEDGAADGLQGVGAHEEEIGPEAQVPGRPVNGQEAAHTVHQGRRLEQLLEGQQREREAAGVHLQEGRAGCHNTGSCKERALL